MSEQPPAAAPVDAATDTPPATPTPPAATLPADQDAPPAGAPAEWDGKVESLPEAAQKMIRDLRTESADRRTRLTTAEKAQQDAIRALAKAAGIELPADPDDTPPDAAALASQVAQEREAARAARVELAVYRTAPTHQGDPAALLDSRSFLANVADLDPTAEDFTSKVDAAIKAAVDANPKLKAARAAGQSSVDHPGGSGEGAHDLDAQIAEAQKRGDTSAVIALRRQKAYSQ